jgi:hypothetical protein
MLKTIFELLPLAPKGESNAIDRAKGKYKLPGAPYLVESNKGPYGPNDTQMDLINEFHI